MKNMDLLKVRVGQTVKATMVMTKNLYYVTGKVTSVNPEREGCRRAWLEVDVIKYENPTYYSESEPERATLFASKIRKLEVVQG